MSVSRPSAAITAATRLLASITASAVCALVGFPLSELSSVLTPSMKSATSRTIGLDMASQARPHAVPKFVPAFRTRAFRDARKQVSRHQNHPLVSKITLDLLRLGHGECVGARIESTRGTLERKRMKPLKYLAIAVLVTAPLMVESTHVVHAAGGRLVSAGSVTLSSLAAASGADGLSNPETHAEADDEAAAAARTAPGPSVQVPGNPVAHAGAEVGVTFAGLNHRDQRLANNGNQFSLEPPDQALCVGPRHVLESVNDAVRVINKAGAAVSPTISLTEFFRY